MKTTFMLGFVLLFSLNVAAQTDNSQSAIESMVATERAFAKTSDEKGTRPAFLEFIADDGILFRPAAVNGKKWMLEHPVPPTEKRPLLAWEPAFADIAAAGDMGFTFGPWEFKADRNDAKPVAFGHFVTVWKKQPDGSWRFAIDHGISHPQANPPPASWRLPANYKAKLWKQTQPIVETAKADLMSRDRDFSKASSSQGVTKAFTAFSAEDLKLFRNDSAPYYGIDSAVQALSMKTPKDRVLVWDPLGGEVSQSGDLGFTHGTYTVTTSADTTKVIERGNYFRIWKKGNGPWKLVVDVSDPLPAK